MQAQQPATLSAGTEEISKANMTAQQRVENFKLHDKSGVVMTITAMGVVFAALIILYLLFNLVGSTAVLMSHKRVMKTGMSKEEAKGISQRSGEIYAAIAMAIYEATELHDDENAILTIKNTVRNYSPWSSKIYSLRETPKR
jgi:Na+-transporting methylmalonyl-CoA/oxaloacetate decarboxylase gamma subunit